MNPLVTVVCLSYNHSIYLEAAVESVMQQTYKNIELILVDDFSRDNSLEVIKNIQKKYPLVKVILNQENIGNCRSFNKALAIAQGKYMIDLAADDLLREDKIEKQVSKFESLDDSYGVIFTDVILMDKDSGYIKHHYTRNEKGEIFPPVPSGDIYKFLIASYFISPPSMMMRKTVLDELGGYDETLAYEDFDFWVRSSRNYKYYFLDNDSIYKRILSNSLSSKFNRIGQYEMFNSTYRVCEKILWLNKTKEEHLALKRRISYELKQCILSFNFSIILKYLRLLLNLNSFINNRG